MQRRIILSTLFALTTLPALADNLNEYKEESRAAAMPFLKELVAKNQQAIAEGGANLRSKSARRLHPRWPVTSPVKRDGNSHESVSRFAIRYSAHPTNGSKNR